MARMVASSASAWFGPRSASILSNKSITSPRLTSAKGKSPQAGRMMLSRCRRSSDRERSLLACFSNQFSATCRNEPALGFMAAITSKARTLAGLLAGQRWVVGVGIADIAELSALRL